MIRGAEPGEYHAKDIVVVIDPTSRHYGAVGVVEPRPDHDTDLVHMGDITTMQQPKFIRRVRPGDRLILS